MRSLFLNEIAVGASDIKRVANDAETGWHRGGVSVKHRIPLHLEYGQLAAFLHPDTLQQLLSLTTLLLLGDGFLLATSNKNEDQKTSNNNMV